jgi:hypothetical protein
MSGTDADLLQKEDQKTNKKLRPLIKKFLLIMLNNKSGNGAIQALREAYIKGKIKAERRGETFVDPPFRIIKKNMDPVIDMLAEQHAPIARHFFQGCGNTLMYHDSQIAEEVMMHFAQQGIPSLPVHDSFVIAEEHECR